MLGDILVWKAGKKECWVLHLAFMEAPKIRKFCQPYVSCGTLGVFRQIFEFEQGKQKIKVRPNKIGDDGGKLDSSSSRVIRRKTASDDLKKLSPETSASSVQRRGQ